MFARLAKSMYLCTRKAKNALLEDPLAQLVEHNTFNVGVLGSSPKRITERALVRVSFFAFLQIKACLLVTHSPMQLSKNDVASISYTLFLNEV